MISENSNNKKAWKNICTIGHVDHGKSTLMGYLLYKFNEVSDRELNKITLEAEKSGKKSYRLAFILDKGTEREKGLTIVTSYYGFCIKERKFMIVDNPGHDKFLKMIVKGVSHANYAVVTIDANDWKLALGEYDRDYKIRVKDDVESKKGLVRMYIYLASQFGIEDFIIAITKMDLVNFSEDTFKDISKSISQMFNDFANLKRIKVIPISIDVKKLTDENVITKSKKMSWWNGETFVDYLYNLQDLSLEQGNTFRMPIERYFSNVMGQPKILAGRVTSGFVKLNSNVFIHPEKYKCRIASIKMRDESYLNKRQDRWGTKTVAYMNEIVGFGIRGPEIDSKLQKRHKHTLLMSSHKDLPIPCQKFRAEVFIFSKYHTLMRNRFESSIHFGTLYCRGKLEQILTRKPDFTNNGSHEIEILSKGDIGEIIISLNFPLPIDTRDTCLLNSRFVMLDQDMIIASGIVLELIE